MNIIRTVAMATIVLLAGSVLATVETIAQPTEASAASGGGFDAGNIIDDSLFFDGAAMTGNEIQTLLQAKEAPCTPGVVCAYQAQLRTPSMAAESGLCNAYTSSGLERLADVVAKIGAACGISQKVLLVLIQKEQHLITASNPDQWAYDQATGFACPDTAPCDGAYSGFFYQVWYAARQFKLYALHPTWYNHLAGRVNTVRYHPNAGCGSSNVYIENVATAGLYNYTPYQPNAAALANLYGEGDSCSTYGNRNFWTIYTGWFGPTTSSPAIVALHQSLGGNAGVLGAPDGGLERIGSGLGQRFEHGSIFSSSAGTFAVMYGAIRDAWLDRGGPLGFFGWPTAAESCVASVCSQSFQGGVVANDFAVFHAAAGGSAGTLGAAQAGVETIAGNGGGRGQRYANGSVFTSAAGMFAVMAGPVRDEYFSRGGPNGALGWPIAAQTCVGTSCSQAFQGGTVANQIGTLYASLGGATGVLGKAQAGIEAIAAGIGGTGQRFDNGSIFSSSVGTFAVMAGPVRDEYFARGGPGGALGWPIAAQDCSSGSCAQAFQGGTVSNQIGALYASLGGASGALGKAQAGIETIALGIGGTGQRYANGSIFSSSVGTFAVSGAVRDEYFSRGGPGGALGWPTAAQDCSTGTCSQTFENGTVSNQIGALYSSLGGTNGVLGKAEAGIETIIGNGNGSGQRFVNGSIFSSTTAGTWAVYKGTIRDRYFAQGGPVGTLGWPTAAQVCTAGVCTQAFQGGTLTNN